MKMTLLMTSLVLVGSFAHAQIADLNGGNPPPIGSDPSDAPPPPPPPGGPSDVNNQPKPPAPIPQNPNRPQWPNDPDQGGQWPSQPQLPQVSPQVLQRACNTSMQGRADLRFGEELFRSGDFVLNLRVQGMSAPNVYNVLASTASLSRKDPVIGNDTGAGTCTIDMYGRVVINLHLNKRGDFSVTSDDSIATPMSGPLSYQGRVNSSIGSRRVELHAR